MNTLIITGKVVGKEYSIALFGQSVSHPQARQIGYFTESIDKLSEMTEKAKCMWRKFYEDDGEGLIVLHSLQYQWS